MAEKALKEPDNKLPDILCFQEVENIQAIRTLNQRYLNNHYKHSMLIDAYDPRNIDVGILSVYPIVNIRSNIDSFDNNKRLFSRDCLEVEIDIPGNKNLTLFINHFKSKLVKRDQGSTNAQYNSKLRASHGRRLNQAQEVLNIIKKRFQGQHDTALYAVIGDFNDTPYSPYIKPLINSTLLVDVLGQLRPNDCWTYYWRSKGKVSQIDYLLASKALFTKIQAQQIPHIERKGIGYRSLNRSGQILPKTAQYVFFEKDPVTPNSNGAAPANQRVNFRFNRYTAVKRNWKDNISDHCPVKFWF